MKICWVISQAKNIDPTVTYRKLKDIAPVWGSYTTWREFDNDNSVCGDPAKARELISKAFQSVTNLYLPKSCYVDLGEPRGVKLFESRPNAVADDDIIATSITAGQYEIILLLGFKFETGTPYFEQLKTIISGNDQVQFVAVDTDNIPEELKTLPNFTNDTYEQVVKILV